MKHLDCEENFMREKKKSFELFIEIIYIIFIHFLSCVRLV